MPAAITRMFIASLIIATAAGCSSNPVRSNGSWADGTAGGKSYSRLLVLGISPDINQRCAFEEAMAQALRSTGAVAKTSCTILGSKEPITREAVEKAIAAMQADAVLATRPLGGSTKLREGGTNETRGDSYYKATDFGYDYGYGYGYGNWGAYGVPVVYGQFQTAPAEFFLESRGSIQTDCYDTGNAALIYSMQTDAERLESRVQALVVMTTSVAEQLKRDGLIR